MVIIGGGFAGLHLAKKLHRAPVSITLVDRRNHHLFQPMLYQVATAALSPKDIATPLRTILRRQRNLEVQMAEVTSVDPTNHTVGFTTGQALSYDYCVVATGARHAYFGRDDWEPHAPGLKAIEDALEVRRRVLLAFEKAEREPDPVKRNQYLTFVVIGGGPTGVEMAGAIAELRRFALARDFRQIDPREATVLLLEGGPRLLSGYPEKLSTRAKTDLRALGVEVRENTLVTNITAGWVEAAGWTIPATTVIWAAGNQASPLVATLGAPLDRQGRALVEPDCTIPGHPDCFVLGDAAAFLHQERLDGPLPGTCPVAIQMGNYTADAITADLAKKPRAPFRYRDKGQLAVIGRGHAVADIWRFHFAGVLAWWIWAVVHIAFLVSFRSRLMVLIEWGWSYIRYAPGARLITGETGEFAVRNAEPPR